jgi:hypothetical protein
VAVETFLRVWLKPKTFIFGKIIKFSFPSAENKKVVKVFDGGRVERA